DSLVGGDAVEHGEARQRGPGATVPTATGDLDTLGGRPGPGLTESVGGGARIRRQPEVAPAQPPVLPREWWRFLAEQVEAERRRGAGEEWRTHSSAADEAPRRETEDARCRGLPGGADRGHTRQRSAGDRLGSPPDQRRA